MRIPFFASFIVFIVWLSYEISKSRREMEKKQDSFWERERRANRTRRKPLDTLAYITIPLSLLPMETCSEEDEVAECLSLIRELSGQTIVNLTGYSNTDLKLMYGAPTLAALSEYDQNYTLLARTLQKWASLLYERGYVPEARSILEFAVSTHTDVSGSYFLLASIYRSLGEWEKIDGLVSAAKSLQPPMSAVIVRTLKESLSSHKEA